MDIAAAYDARLFVTPEEALLWVLSRVGQWQGRRSELSKLSEWQEAQRDSQISPGDQVLSLIGERGIGKTWFLQYLAYGERRLSPTIYLDLEKRNEFSLPGKYVEAVEEAVHRECGDGPIILLLDNVPPQMDGHLRALEDAILRPHLTHRFSLVIMALIHPSHVCWRAPVLRGGEHYSMSPFQESQTRDQLQRLEQIGALRNGVMAHDLYEHSGGLPLLTYLLATWQPSTAFEFLLDHWFSGLPPAERERVQNYLEAVSVLDVLEHASIQRALEVYSHYRPEAKGFPAHAGGVRNVLQKYWLARPASDSPGRLVLIESVRRAAEQVLKEKDTTLHTLLQEVAQGTSEEQR
jgi:hypothetical protein